MNRLLKTSVCLLAVGMLISSCKKNAVVTSENTDVSADVLTQIKAMGFSTDGAFKSDGGYIVEGDIFIAPEQLGQSTGGPKLLIANTEQYRTTNTVSGLPRVITVTLDSKLSPKAGYVAALDEMVNRYNAESLKITFQRVTTTNATIVFSNANGSYLASSGFPSNTGAPYGSVKVNSRAIGTGTSTTFINYLATIFAHEVGHCIGFRHTDYMDRSYSCGGSATNEGASTVGAILIPGTPSGPDAKSWMLACIGSGVNRPFNSNDKTALSYLYK